MTPDCLDESLAAWFRQFSRHRLALAHQHTHYSYDLNLRRFAEFLGRPPALADLTDANVMGCVGWMIREKKLSIASASKLRDNLKTFWEYIARKGGITVWPELPPIQEPENPPIALPLAKLKLIWELVGRQPGDVCGIPEALWLRSLLGVMWSTGERIMPFRLAEWAEFDLADGFWTVPAKHRKGGKRGAVYALHHGAVALLVMLQRFGHAKVWPMDFAERTLYDRMGCIMVAAGLPNDRRHKFHIFRKSVATMVEVFGGNSVDVMGWRDPSMRDVYIDRKIAPKDSAAKRLPWLDDLGEGPTPAA